MNQVRSLLVIDDDKDDFELIEEAAKQINPDISVYFLDRCENAYQYKEHSIDLVFLDINMPHHDGFSWLKGIRESGYQMPIIMYTNSHRPEHIIQAYKEGANLYYTKPTSFKELINGLRQLISLDWTDPSSITQNYWRDGHYATFKVV
jgi:two-component system, OmpR family, response regulator